MRALSIPVFTVHAAEATSIIARLQSDPTYAASLTSLTTQQIETHLKSDLDTMFDAVLYWSAQIGQTVTAVIRAIQSVTDLVQALKNGDDFVDQLTSLFGSGGNEGNLVDQTVALLFGRSGGIHQIVRASSSTAGAGGNSDSLAPSISGDGRYVAFYSYASDLVAGDTNGAADIFVYDRQNKSIARVSVGPGGAQANNQSLDPAISADGRFVAFQSSATNLVSGDGPGWPEIFVYDRTTGTTTRVSKGLNNQEPDFPSDLPSIVSDATGHYLVAYASDARNLVAGDTAGERDIFLYDSATKAIQRITNGIGAQANGNSNRPSISANGMVAFESDATNLVANDTNSLTDVFLYNGSAIVRVSTGLNGAQANGVSDHASISSDGNFVAFESLASDLVSGDTNGFWDIFVYNRTTGAIERVSLGINGAQANNDSFNPSISGDGRYVTFSSRATNLLAGQTTAPEQTFVYDRELHITKLVSVSAAGEEANTGSIHPVISTDGATVAFESAATNLFRQDSGPSDIFVTDTASFFKTGGPQNDVIFSSAENDVLDGGSGINTVSYANIAAAVTASLAVSEPQNTGGGGTDTLTNFQNITGGGGADHLTGDAGDNALTGGGGNDTISGGGGTDTAVYSGKGSDYRFSFNRAAQTLTVSDQRPGAPDGVDTVTGVEFFQFADRTVVLPALIAPVHNDINRDGFSDILLQNGGGTTANPLIAAPTIWELNSAGTIASRVNLSFPGSTWAVVGTGDFNGDGFIDPLWRNSVTGAWNWVDVANGNVTHNLGTSTTSYVIVGVGDLNGDGFADALWRNNTSGAWGWTDINNHTAWHDLGISSSTYSLVGLGDFNGDGATDVLWRNNTSGAWGWTDINAHTAWHDLGASSTSYSIVGTGDFNGDGFADALWRNNATGAWGWTDIHSHSAWHDLGASSTAYTVAAVGDYTGDGLSDVLWQAGANGDVGFSAFGLTGAPKWHDLGAAGTTGHVSFPVVLDLGGNGIDIAPVGSSTAQFDMDGGGTREPTAWAGRDNGILAIDRGADGSLSGDGVIDQSREILFTEWAPGTTSDMAALRQVFDTNQNGALDPGDLLWDDFRVWQDANQDGISQAGEVKTLGQLGITSIGLTPSGPTQQLADGSLIQGVATYTRVDGTTGLAADAALAYEPQSVVAGLAPPSNEATGASLLIDPHR
jgi:hypothetical protein